MTTASNIISEAFAKATIRASESALTSAENSDGLKRLNDLIAEWGGVGILKNCEPVNSVSLDIKDDRHEKPAIVCELSVRLAGEFGLPISQDLRREKYDTYNSMVTVNMGQIKVNYPDNLPTGSGNEDNYQASENFYSGEEKGNF